MTHKGALLLVAGIAFAGCDSSTDPRNDTNQQYLFEVEYLNHSWGYVMNGIVIDKEGNVSAYDHSHAEWAHSESESYSLGQLNDKYEHSARSVGSVDNATLTVLLDRVANVVDEGPAPVWVCADAGDLSYRAFRYDSSTELYEPILLRIEGDRPYQNSSADAEAIADWMRAFILTLEDPRLAPFSLGSCTP